jgi:hypothetical protein
MTDPTEPSELAKGIAEAVRKDFGIRAYFPLGPVAYVISNAGLADLEARCEAAEQKVEEDTEALRGLLRKNDDLLAALVNHRCSGCGAGYHDKGIGPDCYETVADEYAADLKRERDEARGRLKKIAARHPRNPRPLIIPEGREIIDLCQGCGLEWPCSDYRLARREQKPG